MLFKLDKDIYKSKLQSFKIKDKIKFHQYLADLLEIKKSDKVLDIGCGYGQSLASISPRLGKAGKAVGLDMDESLLAAAEKILKSEISEKKIELVKFNAAEKLPFSNDSFNKIVCHNVIECIANKNVFINECYRVLGKRGILVMSHNDFDAQIYNSSFADLSRKLIHNYCDFQQEGMEASDGMIGRKLYGIFNKSRFKDFELKIYVMNNIRYKRFEYGYMISKDIADTARKSGNFDELEVNKWLEDLGEKDKKREYVYSNNIYVIVARKQG